LLIIGVTGDIDDADPRRQLHLLRPAFAPNRAGLGIGGDQVGLGQGGDRRLQRAAGRGLAADDVPRNAVGGSTFDISCG
jgi:hypothetical protein